MAVLAGVALVAAWAQHDRSDDSAGRSSLPLIGLILSSSDIAHFERIYTRLEGDNPDPSVLPGSQPVAAGSAPLRRCGLQRAGEEPWPDSGLPLGRA